MVRTVQVPIPIARAEFADWLHQLAAAVEFGDSAEGSLEYLLDYDDEGPDGQDTVMVRASVRTGNRMGQGGMIMLGKWMEMEEQDD